MKLHFLVAGRQLQEPLEMKDALVRANWQRTSADAFVFSDGNGIGMIRIPWASSVEEAQLKIIEFTHGTAAIHKALRDDVLRTYVQNPANGAYMRIPRLYWDGHPIGGEYVMQVVEDATGWDPAMEGLPILVAAEDIDVWHGLAQAAIGHLHKQLTPKEAVKQGKKKRTRPEPRWVPQMRNILVALEAKNDELAKKARAPLVPPTNPKLIEKLIGQGFEELQNVNPSTFSYHRRKVEDEIAANSRQPKIA